MQITAEAARALATLESNVNPDEVYMQAIFHEMGATYILHVVDECFDEASRQIRKLAKENGASEVSHRVSEIKSAAPVLDKLLPMRAPQVSYRLAEQYNLSHFQLSNPGHRPAR